MEVDMKKCKKDSGISLKKILETNPRTRKWNRDGRLGLRTSESGISQGFTIRFDNGYYISVQFGYGNYCTNRIIKWNDDESAINVCDDCETAIFKPNNNFLKYKGDDVQGYQTTNDVAETIAYILTLEPNNYGRVKK